MTGPKPETEKEYLIEIYNRQGKQTEDIKTLCDGVHDHENRIRKLEISEACEDSFNNGKTSIWVNYKEFFQIFFACSLSVVGTILLIKMGLKP
jgi:hypothetical protein